MLQKDGPRKLFQLKLEISIVRWCESDEDLNEMREKLKDEAARGAHNVFVPYIAQLEKESMV